MKKRVLSLLLAVTMVLTMLPFSAAAEGADTDVSLSVRPDGPAVGQEGDFDYAAAYTAAGVTGEGGTNTFTYTVDASKVQEYVTGEQNNAAVTALTKDGNLYIGVAFKTPESFAETAKSVKYAIGGGEPTSIDLTQDGESVHNKKLITYFGFGSADGNTFYGSKSWTVNLTWKGEGDTVLGTSTAVVTRKMINLPESLKKDVTPQVREDGNAGDTPNFDFDGTYTNAGINGTFDANTASYTVDGDVFKTYFEKEENAGNIAALNHGGNLYYGIVFPKPDGAAGATMVSATIGDSGAPVQVALTPDGDNALNNEFIEYFGFATGAGKLLQDTSWPVKLEWCGANGAILAYADVTVSRSSTPAKTAINEEYVELNAYSKEYSGLENLPVVTVRDGPYPTGNVFTENEDYRVSYKKGDVSIAAAEVVDAGSYTVVVEGIGAYTGTIEKTYEITKKSLTVTPVEQTINADEEIQTDVRLVNLEGICVNQALSSITLTADKSEKIITASQAVIFDKNGQGKDVTDNYTITYKPGKLVINGDPGEPTNEITADCVVLDQDSKEYTGAQNLPAVTVTVGGKTLAADTDYTVTYEQGENTVEASAVTDAGAYTVIVTGKGEYTGTVEKTYTISQKAVTITAKSQTIEQGGSIATGTEQVIVDGLVADHTISAITLTADEAQKTITPSAATIVDSQQEDVTANYVISYTNGELTVTEPGVPTVDVTPAVRGNGPAAGVAEDFDYQAAYKDAGITWKSATNGFTYTVDEKTIKAFAADEANADKITALTNAGYLFIGVVFPTPSVPSNIAKLSYTVNGGEAVEVDLSGEDGSTLFNGQYINYFGLAGVDGTVLSNSTWTIAINWKDSSDEVVAKSSVVVERVINEEQSTIPGGGGGSVTPDPEPTPEPDDSTVTTTTEVKPEINGSTAQATVDSTSMNQTVEDAIHAAAEQQKAPEVEVKVPVTDGVDSVEVTLPQDSVAALGKAEGSVLTISSDVGVVSLDNTAVASVAQQAKEQITIIVKPVDSSELNDKQQETVGNAPVYDITVKSGNTVISSLGGGKATVKVPYTLKAGENSNGIVAYFLDDMGNIHICSSKYDAENEMVIFTTTHFSKYMVKYVAEMDWDNTFTDVDNGQWYYPAVGFVVENGLMNGYGDDTFGPSNKLKRSEFAQILYNAEGKPDISNEDLGYPFEDVAGDVWYADAVYWARLNGIVEGVTDTAFGPDKYITREQLAVMLYRYAEFKEYDLTKGDATLNDFTDKAAISAYAKTAMEWAVSVGVVNGKENKILDPKGTAKRAEVAQMLQNFYGVFEK